MSPWRVSGIFSFIYTLIHKDLYNEKLSCRKPPRNQWRTKLVLTYISLLNWSLLLGFKCNPKPFLTTTCSLGCAASSVPFSMSMVLLNILYTTASRLIGIRIADCRIRMILISILWNFLDFNKKVLNVFCPYLKQ